jgi:hypothetical protein
MYITASGMTSLSKTQRSTQNDRSAGIVGFDASERSERMLLKLLQSDPNFFQELAWQASAAVALVGVVQFGLGVWRQRRETREAQAKFAYELLDKMFADEWANEFLYSLDGSVGGQSKGSQQVFTSFDAVFGGSGIQAPVQHEGLAYSRLDAFLYFADRFEHAIGARLIIESDIKMPIQYYVRLLAPYRQRLKPYLRRIGYDRAVELFGRFDPAWNK